MVLNQVLNNPPCPKCAPLGHTSYVTGHVLMLVTLAPDPLWNEYADMLPDVQYRVLHRVLHNSKIIKKLTAYFNQYKILSEHYEFAKNGNLHSHCLVEVPSEYGTYERNLHTVSKHYAKIIGRSSFNSQISANVKFVSDDDVYIYLNKENAYDPWHYVDQPDLLAYMQPPTPPLLALNNSDVVSE